MRAKSNREKIASDHFVYSTLCWLDNFSLNVYVFMLTSCLFKYLHKHNCFLFFPVSLSVPNGNRCAGNLITIIALLQHQKLRGHATTAFVLSLCISDLLFCSFSMPLTAIRYINKVGIRFVCPIYSHLIDVSSIL